MNFCRCKNIVLLSCHIHTLTQFSLLLACDKTHPKPHVQTDATTPNIVGSCCIRLYVRVAKSVTGSKLCATTRNNMQQGVQIKRTQHLTSDNVASVCTGA